MELVYILTSVVLPQIYACESIHMTKLITVLKKVNFTVYNLNWECRPRIGIATKNTMMGCKQRGDSNKIKI